jgi:predicted membrane protein
LIAKHRAEQDSEDFLMTWLQRLTLLPIFLVLSVVPALADLLPANGAESAANFAEISVTENKVRVALEIDFADVHAFLEKAPKGEDPAANLAARTGRAFQVSADGAALVPETHMLEVRPRKTRTTAFRPTYGRTVQDNRSPQVIYVVLDYAFDQQPTEFTFVPPLTQGGMPAASVGVIFDHLGVAVTDYRYLSQPEVFHPDWEDPWYSRFANPNLTRHHKSALMSFVSVEPREVRHEVIFRLRDLETWTNLDLVDATHLDRDTMAVVNERAIDLFSNSNPMVIDGQIARPTTAKVQQLSVGVEGLKILEDLEQTNRSTALLGIILSYPQERLPQEISLDWEFFTEDAKTIPVQVTDPAGAVPGQVTRQASEVVWKNYILNWNEPEVTPIFVASTRSFKIPIPSLLLFAFALMLAGFAFKKRDNQWKGLAAGSLALCLLSVAVSSMTTRIAFPSKSVTDTAAATQITEALISNLAVTRLETDDQRLSNALKTFVTTENLGDVKTETMRGLSATLPSGAVAKTDAIEGLVVERVEPLAQGGDQILARWVAAVSGGHWGHMHRRTVSYRALLDVKHHEGAWFLSGLTVLEARMDTQPTTTGGNS